MAYYPINFIPFQFETVSGLPASGYVLKAYDAAFPSSSIAMATDASGVTTVASITLNSMGYPAVSGNVIIPYIDRTYNLSLYPSQAAADSDTGAIWSVLDKAPITLSDLNDAELTGDATAENLVVSGIAVFADIIVVDSINDVNANELLEFGTTTAAVNHVKVTNAATGNGPIVSASGGDTNIDLNYQAKGTGVHNFKATATKETEIRLFEDTDNGTNYIGLKAPATIASNITFEFPAAFPSANNAGLVSSTAGVLSYSSQGRVLQYVESLTGSVITCSTTVPLDNTIPQNTEGTEVTTLAITPISATSRLFIELIAFTGGPNQHAITALYKDATANALAAGLNFIPTGQTEFTPVYFSEISGSTSARTYKMRTGAAAGTCYINSFDGNPYLGGVMKSGIRITEVEI